MKLKNSRTARTPLAKALRLARTANRRDAPPADELVEMRRESARPGTRAPWTRRRFLKTSAAAAAVTLAGGSVLASRKKKTKCAKAKGAAPRIAVVGAGLAGLSAAYKLKKLGHRAEVYEAAKRMGGRIYTAYDVMAPGLFAELGGEWVNEDHEEVLSLVKELGLELSDLNAPSEGKLLSSNYFEGTNYTDAQLIEALQPVVALMEDDIRTLRKAYRAYMRGNLEKARSLAAPLDEISMEEYLDRIGASGWVRTFLDVASGSNGGLEPGQQTAINILGSVYLEPPSMYLFDEGEERYKIVGGCQGIIRGLADGLDEGQVKPAHRLEAVKSSGDGFTLTFQDPKGSALDVKADFVIMTVPFSILRDIEMRMEMPPDIKKAIAEMGYGVHTKLLAGVDKRVWREKGYSGGAYTDEPFQVAYDNSQMTGYEGDVGGLTFYLGGQASIDAGAGTAPEQVERLMLGAEKVFPGVTAVLNGKTHRFDWGAYPYALGGYPCLKPGQLTTFGDPSEPLGNMLFAGDHCSEYGGYINGAVESGMRVAKDLVDRLGGKA
ncbi:MAG: FAD-dependent oxidoreductase [Acidobacteriota bacterium]|nr:MAG: FAD-dependent oxidoreductase [Acidobacteriota bacterium]